MRSMRKLGTRFREYREYTALDSQFHQTIVDSARNEVLSASYKSMHAVLAGARMSLFRDAGTIGSDDAVNEHAEILAAYAKRDGKRAEAAIRTHLQGALARMLSALQRSQGLANEAAPRWGSPESK
jgi:DNA-binding GntR family transcriptional regulator